MMGEDNKWDEQNEIKNKIKYMYVPSYVAFGSTSVYLCIIIYMEITEELLRLRVDENKRNNKTKQQRHIYTQVT